MEVNMKKSSFDMLKLENQLCFPLYAAAKEVISKYRPFLADLDLTYTQYIVMMVLWEEKSINVKKIGDMLYLDSGTLSPLIKSLEKKGYVYKLRAEYDERVVEIILTPKGEEIKNQAKDIPMKIGSCINLEPEEAKILYKLLYKMLK
ncbi:MAG: MarR family transcriptional regulator [Ruminococcaceae bacterium]|nr:MarR family transcriptional regulator [Oscillospiraceae bacterium]